MSKILRNKNIRNVAIIAHVDHGKTTLVDSMFHQNGLFRKNQDIDERVMDSMDLEREKGITIAAKNCSIVHNGIKINIVDTPGHADFGGEVERALSMVDGAILLVDASEGPLPQTRFVLKKALEANIKIIPIINKIDRKDSVIDQVLDKIYDLFIDLDATEEQIDTTIFYAIGRDGLIGLSPSQCSNNLELLFNTIIEQIPAPEYKIDAAFQMRVCDLGYSNYLGRLAVGKVINGSAGIRDDLICIDSENQNIPIKVSQIQTYIGTKIMPIDKVIAGDIAIISGLDDVSIGDTICTAEVPICLPRINIDPPTVSMLFTINDSPMSGLEGKYTQSRKIVERLKKETILNIGIQIEEKPNNKDCVLVKGRGELQLAILVETMRREGYEFCIGRPEVILKNVNGVIQEPIEKIIIDCNEEFIGIVTKKMCERKSKMINLVSDQKGRSKIEFDSPSRALIGYRDEFLTDTRGTGIINSYFDKWSKFRGSFELKRTGSIVSDRSGVAVSYALFNLEPRGYLFIKPGNKVYEGMIIGKHNKEVDINVNPMKEKKLTNMRASGKDDSIQLTPASLLSIEKAINLIARDELVEITPKSIRLRKKILDVRKRNIKKK